MLIDPVSLKLFVSIVEEGTIAGAADREHIAASAVSKRVSELEETLRTQLLRRTNKGVGPTEVASVPGRTEQGREADHPTGQPGQRPVFGWIAGPFDKQKSGQH